MVYIITKKFNKAYNICYNTLMIHEAHIPTNIEEVLQYSNPLFADILRMPNGYSTDTNVYVEPIHHAWISIQQGSLVDPELQKCLSSPKAFIDKLAPKRTQLSQNQILRGLGRRIGIYMIGLPDHFGFRSVSKTGRHANILPEPVELWIKYDSNRERDMYLTQLVKKELEKFQSVDFFESGYHATNSAVLEGIARRKALVSSKIIVEAGEELQNGEVSGERRWFHEQVFVYDDKISDGYGHPRWFDQYEVVFGISIAKQCQYLEATYQERGIWSLSEGYEIGSQVPLKNLNFIAAPAAHIPKLRQWVQENCPEIPTTTRESLYIKCGL